jgi:hypothetical protein
MALATIATRTRRAARVAVGRIGQQTTRTASRAARQFVRNQSSFDAITGGAGSAIGRSVTRNVSRAAQRVGSAGLRVLRGLAARVLAALLGGRRSRVRALSFAGGAGGG